MEFTYQFDLILPFIILMTFLLVTPFLCLLLDKIISQMTHGSRANTVKWTGIGLMTLTLVAILLFFPWQIHQLRGEVSDLSATIENQTGIAVPVKQLYAITVEEGGGYAEFHAPSSQKTIVGDVVTEYKVEYEDDMIYLFEKSNDGLIRIM